MEWYGVVDRFEGAKAVVVPDEIQTTLIIDKQLLPKGCREGDHIRFQVEIIEDKDNQASQKVKILIEELSQQDNNDC